MDVVATRYLGLIPTVKGFEKNLQRELGGPAFAKMGSAGGQSLGGRFVSGMGKTLKRTIGGIGIAAGGIFATSLVKGFGRLSAIENAEAKLRGLGNTSDDVTAIMENALAAVKGTAFGMDQAATTAASAVAAGIKPGKELESYLRLVGDAATIAGVDMQSMGSIFNKVATSGKVQGDVFAQLGDQGIPIVQLLAKEMGISADEVYKLGAEGKISSDQFLAAMSSMSGAALEGGKTTSGAFKNMMAALSRFGATMLKGIYPLVGPFFNQLTALIDGAAEAVTPFLDAIAPKLEATAQKILGWSSLFTGSLKGIIEVFRSGDFDPSKWAEGIEEDSPLVDITYRIRDGWLAVRNTVGPVITDLVGRVQAAMPTIQSAWGVVQQALRGVITSAQEIGTAVLPYIQDLWGWFSKLDIGAQALLGGGALVGGLAIFGKLGDVFKAVSGSIQKVLGPLGRFAPLLRFIGGPVGLIVTGLLTLVATNEDVRNSFGNLLTVLSGALMSTLETLVPVAINLAEALGPVLAAAAVALGSALSAAAPVVVGVADGLAAFIGWIEPALPLVVGLGAAVFVGVKAYQAWQAVMGVFRLVALGASIAQTTLLGAVNAATLGVVRQRIATVAATVQQKAAVVWSKAAAAAQWLWNAALTANPIGLIIAGIAALVAGLVLFFTKTEIGRKIWSKVWGAIKAAAKAVADWFMNTALPVLQAAWEGIASGAIWLYENAILPAWNGIKTAIQVVGDWIVNTLWPALQTAWNAIGTAALWLWNNVMKPAWTGIKVAIAIAVTAVLLYIDLLKWYFNHVIAPVALWLWEKVMKPAWEGIKTAIGAVVAWFRDTAWPALKTAWDAVAFAATWLWQNVLKPAWAGIQIAINAVVLWFQTVAWPMIKKVIGWIQTAFELFKIGLQVIWNAVKTAINAVVGWFRNVAWPIIETVIGWLKMSFEGWKIIAKAVWDAVKTAINAVAGWFKNTAWPLIRTVIDNIKTGFNVMRDSLKTAWNYVKDKVINPVATWFRDTIKPMFDTVTDGITDAFNSLKESVKTAWNGIRDTAKTPVKFLVETIIRDGIIKKYNEVAHGMFNLPKVDEGKFTVGWHTGGYTGPGSKYQPAGIVHADEYVIRKESQRSLARQAPGFLDALNRHGARALNGLGMGYATGGRVKSVDELLREAQSLASSYGLVKTSGYRPGARTAKSGMVSLHALGKAIDVSGSAANMMKFFNAANTHFGSVLTELLYSPAGARNLHRSGKRYPNSGATLRNHFNHVHIGFLNGGVPGGGDIAGGGFSLNPFDGLWDSLKAKAREGVGDNAFGDMLFKVPENLIGKAVDWATEKLAAVGGFISDTAQGVGGRARWTPVMTQALTMKGQFGVNRLRWGLDRLMQESSGNPRAINNWDSNAKKGTPSKGLMQVIGPTFRQYAEPGYDKDIYDPLSNILASINYTLARYGSLEKGWTRKGGYAMGGLVTPTLYDNGGQVPPGLNIIANKTKRPETMLPPEESAALTSLARSRRSSAPESVYNFGDIHGYTPEEVEREIEKKRKRREKLRAR